MLRPTVGVALLIACGALTGCAQAPASSATQANTVETGTLTGEVGDPRNRARIHTELGSAYFERGNMGVALEELHTAIAADPNYAAAYSVLGLVHMELRENTVAQQHFERAPAAYPNDPDINNNYGWFLCQTGREQQSIAYFLAALKNPLYNTPARSYANAGLCSLKNNERDAIDYFEHALRSARQSPGLAQPGIGPVQTRAAGGCARLDRALQQAGRTDGRIAVAGAAHRAQIGRPAGRKCVGRAVAAALRRLPGIPGPAPGQV